MCSIKMLIKLHLIRHYFNEVRVTHCQSDTFTMLYYQYIYVYVLNYIICSVLFTSPLLFSSLASQRLAAG